MWLQSLGASHAAEATAAWIEVQDDTAERRRKQLSQKEGKRAAQQSAWLSAAAAAAVANSDSDAGGPELEDNDKAPGHHAGDVTSPAPSPIAAPTPAGNEDDFLLLERALAAKALTVARAKEEPKTFLQALELVGVRKIGTRHRLVNLLHRYSGQASASAKLAAAMAGPLIGASCTTPPGAASPAAHSAAAPVVAPAATPPETAPAAAPAAPPATTTPARSAPLVSASATSTPACSVQTWRVVYFPFVFVRSSPSRSAEAVQKLPTDSLVKTAREEAGWARLDGDVERWVLIDGTQAGIDTVLLQPIVAGDVAAIESAQAHRESGLRLALLGQLDDAISEISAGLSDLSSLEPSVKEPEETALLLDEVGVHVERLRLCRGEALSSDVHVSRKELISTGLQTVVRPLTTDAECQHAWEVKALPQPLRCPGILSRALHPRSSLAPLRLRCSEPLC